MVVYVVPRVVTATVVVIAVVIALISTSYPSVVVSSSTTQPSPGFETYTSRYQVTYQEATVSTGLAGYSTVTAWYPGNPICDPVSNACTPYPTPTATFVYPQSMTYMYQVTFSSEATLVSTNEFTLFFTQTSYRNIPPYAAVGLTEFQYGIVVLVVVAVVVLGLLMVFTKKRQAQVGLGSAKAAGFCWHCGAANLDAGKFCTNCGVQLEKSS